MDFGERPENSREGSGLEEAAPDHSKEEASLRDDWRAVVNHQPVGWMWPTDI